MSIHNTGDGRGTRLPLFALDQSDAEFLEYSSNNKQDSSNENDSDDEKWVNDTPPQDFKIQFDHFADWRYMLQHGGLGKFLFTTFLARALVIVISFVLLWGTGVLLVMINRFIVWGSYIHENLTKETRLMYMIAGQHWSPYILTTAFLQMVIAHIILLLWAFAFRSTSPYLAKAGLFDTSKECEKITKRVETQNRAAQGVHRSPSEVTFYDIIKIQPQLLKHTFLLALLTVAHVAIMTISMNHTRLPIFVRVRIGTVPISLLSTSYITRRKSSKSSIAAVALASSSLGYSTHLPGISSSRLDVVLGVASSILAVLYTLQIPKTYNMLVTRSSEDGVSNPQGDVEKSVTINKPGPKELQLFWYLLYHTSVLTLSMFAVVVLVSGEIPRFLRDWNLLGTYAFWSLAFVGGLTGSVLFVTTVTLTQLTSPLLVTFIFIPQASLVCPIMLGNRLPRENWFAIILCWMGSGWFLWRRITDSCR